eukprot:m.143288 g.143288  ORF g.143288 m.143288 type:complete len:338 (-) comp14984_c0_seq3:26-1039(-)
MRCAPPSQPQIKNIQYSLKIQFNDISVRSLHMNEHALWCRSHARFAASQCSTYCRIRSSNACKSLSWLAEIIVREACRPQLTKCLSVVSLWLMNRRWLLCCDATGTLIRVRESVGAQYARFIQAQDSSVKLNEQITTSLFMEEFSKAAKQHPCFGAREGISSQAWWQPVFVNTVCRSAQKSFPEAVLHAAFKDAYAALGTARCWELIPDTHRTIELLRAWRLSHGPTAVLSNFDERLPGLLAELGLADLFDVILTSRELGEEKPSAAAFKAVQTHPRIQVPPENCIHVGDNVKKDVQGALGAGWHAIGVGTNVEDPRVINIPSMSHLASATLHLMGK